jgi:hypothetical protein
MARNPLAAEVTADVSDFLSGIAAAKGQAEEFGDAAATAARKVDDLGDEAGGATGGVSRLGAASGVAATSVGSLGASAATAAVGVGGLAAVATPLAATLGGVATAGAALAGVFGALGLATVATEGEALSEALAGVKDGVLDAIEPIGDTFAPILVDLIQRLPNVARAVVTALGPLDPFARAVRDAGNALLDVLPAIARFAGNLAREALPVLRRLVRVTAEVVPPAIRTMLEVTRTLGGSLLDLAEAASGLIGPLLDIGTAILDTALPVLSDFIDEVADALAVVAEFTQGLSQSVNGGITSALRTLSRRFNAAITDVRVALVGESGNSGPVISAIRDIGTFLQTQGASLIRAAFSTLADRVVTVARNLRITLVGEGGGGGILVTTIKEFGTFLQNNGASLVRSGFNAVASAAESIVRNLRVTLVGEDGNSGVLNTALSEYATFLQNNATTLVRTGFRSVARVAKSVAQNLSIALVGESGSGGLLNNIIGQFTDFARVQGPKLARTAFEAVGSAIRGVAIELFNAVTGNSDSILRGIIKDFGRYLENDAPGDLRTAINIAFDVIVAAAEGLYEGLVGNSTLLDIINDFAAFLRNEAPGKLTAAAETAFDTLVSTIEATLQADGGFFLLAAFKDGFDAVVSRVSNLQSRLSSAFADVAEAIGEALSGISIDFPEPPSWLQEAAQAISGGLSAALQALANGNLLDVITGGGDGGDDSDGGDDGGGGGGAGGPGNIGGEPPDNGDDGDDSDDGDDGDDSDDGDDGDDSDDGDDGGGGGGGDDPPPPPGGPVNPSPGAASSLSAGVTAPSPDTSAQTTTPGGTSTAELSRAVERGVQRADRTDDLLREQRRTKRAVRELADEIDIEVDTGADSTRNDPRTGGL